MNHLPSKWISSALALGLAISPAIAQNTNYAPGDLVLYFQQKNGANTVYANLGNAATVFRGTAAGADVASNINFLDISAQLTEAFGGGWASDTTLYAGLAAVANTSDTTSTLQDGDPARTLYVSKPRPGVGTMGAANSSPWVILGDTQMSAGANGIQTQNNKLETLYTEAVVTSPVADSTIDDQNPFTAGIQAPAFQGAFDGGVQQVATSGSLGTFGAAGSVHLALDLYRILGKTGVSGQVDGVLRNGSYEGTVTVNSSGQVSFLSLPSYSPGDLVLYFQQKNGANTVYANLGNAATVFRGTAAGADVASKINFLDISAKLTEAFGAGWASDTTIYAGLAAVANTSDTTSALLNGDPARTLYVSKPRPAVGTIGAANSSPWVILGETQMSAGANGIQTQNNKLATLYAERVVVSPVADSTIDDQNPFTAGIQAPAFQGAFDGGVQQAATSGTLGTFGAAGSVHLALDLYRILGKTGVAGQVGGVLRNGSYEGIITVNSSGQVSFIGEGPPPTAYEIWMSEFPTITASAHKLAGADPDGDSANNVEEFAFGGDPSRASDNGGRLIKSVDANGDSVKDFSLTLQVRAGATFTAGGNGTLISNTVDGISYRIEGSTNLVNWTSQVSEVTPNLGSGSPKTGYVFKTFRLNAGNGLSGKGFIHAFVTQ